MFRPKPGLDLDLVSLRGVGDVSFVIRARLRYVLSSTVPLHLLSVGCDTR